MKPFETIVTTETTGTIETVTTKMEKQLHHLLNNKNTNLDELKKLCRDHKPFLNELIDNLKEKNEISKD